MIMIYNRDVVHCMGYRCPLRKECYRYWLHLHAARRATYYGAEAYDRNTNQCKHFIKNEKP